MEADLRLGRPGQSKPVTFEVSFPGDWRPVGAQLVVVAALHLPGPAHVGDVLREYGAVAADEHRGRRADELLEQRLYLRTGLEM